jgi:heme/copper-type cytochrome/quinol oxidase subunit 4
MSENSSAAGSRDDLPHGRVGVHNAVLTRVWVALVSATLLSWVAAEAGEIALLAAVAVLVIAATKVGLVLRYFMEVGRGSGTWGYFFTIWVAAVTGAILVSYWLA